MKLAVVTIAVGAFHRTVSHFTHPLLRDYAERIGADFISLHDIRGHRLPHFAKLEIFSLLNSYDRVLYLDTDLLVLPDADDLFQVVPESSLGICEEGKWADREVAIQSYLKQVRLNTWKWSGKYYNTGVMVLSRQHRSFLAPLKEHAEIANFYEQTFLNVRIQSHVKEIWELPLPYNHTLLADKALGKSRYESQIIHYAGLKCGQYQGCLIELIKQDMRALGLSGNGLDLSISPIPPADQQLGGHPWFNADLPIAKICDHLSPRHPVFDT